MRAALIAGVFSLLAATGAAAEDGCGKFAWPSPASMNDKEVLTLPAAPTTCLASV
jgi:hypothetical protein